MSTRAGLLLVICAVVLQAAVGLAQNPIPNPGFETWSGGDPVGWYTSNPGLPGSVTVTADRHSGSWAVRGDVMEIVQGLNGNPMLVAGDSSEGFLTNVQWESLDGFYKFNSVSGDQLLFNVIFVSSVGTVGGGLFLPPTGSSYQPFAIPFVWTGAELPDTGYITVLLYGPSGEQPHIGSYFQFDDLVLTGAPGCPVTLTGDVDQNGTRATSDIVYLVNHVLKAGPEPLPCRAAGDVSCDGNVSTSDIITLVNYVLKAGPEPCDVCTVIPSKWACP